MNDIYLTMQKTENESDVGKPWNPFKIMGFIDTLYII